MGSVKKVLGIALVSGPGGGKDATGKRLPPLLPPIEEHNWIYCSVGSDLCRAKADAIGMKIEDFNNQRDIDPHFYPDFDRTVDATLLRYCNDAISGNTPFVITSRMLPAILHSELGHKKIPDPGRIIKVLYTGDLSVRVTRIVRREFFEQYGREPNAEEIAKRLDEARDRTLAREARDAARYEKVYGVDDIYNRAYFDCVINTTELSLEMQINETLRRIHQGL